MEESDWLLSGDYEYYSRYEYRVHYLSFAASAYSSVLSSFFFSKFGRLLKSRWPILRIVLFVFGLVVSWIISGMIYLTVYKSITFAAFGIIFICILPGLSVKLIPLISFICIWLFVNKNKMSKINAMEKKAKFSLEQIKIASPCPASWEEMLGDDKVRFCQTCSKNVYNLSSMTRDEAQTLVMDHQGKLCGLLYLRKDGSVMTADCPIGFGEIRRRLIKNVAKIAGAAFAFIGLQQFFAGDRALENKNLVSKDNIDEDKLHELKALGYISE